MKDYEKEPFEHLTKEQLEELLKVTNQQMTIENQENIKNKVHQKIAGISNSQEKVVPLKKKRSWKYLLGAVAALSLMVGFTQRDAIKLAYLKAFGTESQQLLLNADKLNESVEDQGLKLTAKSSFKDGDTTYVLMTLQDLTGDRLSSDTLIDRWDMLNGGNTSVVDYDEETKTATLLTKAVTVDEQKDQGFKLSIFKSHREEFQTSSAIDWTSIIQKNPNWENRSMFEGNSGGYNPVELDKLGLDFDDLSKTYLESNIVDVALGREDIKIENTAYKDGLLHVLVKQPNDLNHEAFFLSLSSKIDNKKIDSIASYQGDKNTHNNETGRTDYEETVFNVPESEIGQYDIQVEGWKYKDVVKGDWSIKLKEPVELEKKELSNVQLSNDLELSNIKLSGLSLSFTHEAVKDELPLDVRVIQKNGEEKIISSDYSVIHSNDLKESNVTLMYDYIPLENISKIIINDKTIDVN